MTALPPPKPTCRDLAEARDQVHCVLDDNGMAWAWDSGIADRIITCESHWDVWARGDHGRALSLWQIRYDAHPWVWWLYGDPFNAANNTAAAVKVYREAGDSWSPWSCAR